MSRAPCSIRDHPAFLWLAQNLAAEEESTRRLETAHTALVDQWFTLQQQFDERSELYEWARRMLNATQIRAGELELENQRLRQQIVEMQTTRRLPQRLVEVAAMPRRIRRRLSFDDNTDTE